MTSLADIVAPSLAGPCIDERFTAVELDARPAQGLVEDGDDVREETIDVERAEPLAGDRCARSSSPTTRAAR